MSGAMPLQNRVTPFGDLIVTEARGFLMGNRGRLHDAGRHVVRDAQGQPWIACITSFRGRQRTITSPGSYTELFFLDEAMALAAGRRPCAALADDKDRRLHTDRLAGPSHPANVPRGDARASGTEVLPIISEVSVA